MYSEKGQWARRPQGTAGVRSVGVALALSSLRLLEVGGQGGPTYHPNDRADRFVRRLTRAGSCLVGIAIALQAGGAVGQTHSRKPKSVEPVIGKVVGTLSFKGYRIPVVSGWSGQVEGTRMVLRAEAPGLWLDVEKFPVSSLGRTGFYMTREGEQLLRNYKFGPLPKTSPSPGLHFDFFRNSGDPDSQQRVRSEYAQVVFFPQSVLVARAHFFSKVTAQMRKLAYESGFIIHHITEGATAPRATQTKPLPSGLV